MNKWFLFGLFLILLCKYEFFGVLSKIYGTTENEKNLLQIKWKSIKHKWQWNSIGIYENKKNIFV